MPVKRLSEKFYSDIDVVSIARRLLGKVLCTQIGGHSTSGIITETEAYHGPEDKASHAYGGRRTKRTEVMYSKGGIAYIYLCYGIHHLFNVVTAGEDVPHAVLVRAVKPLEGIDVMLRRRKMSSVTPRLATGPGSMSVALGLTTALTGTDLTDPDSPVWIEDRGVKVPTSGIVAGPRVGIDYAEEWIGKPWRFRMIE